MRLIKLDSYIIVTDIKKLKKFVLQNIYLFYTNNSLTFMISLNNLFFNFIPYIKEINIIHLCYYLSNTNIKIDFIYVHYKKV